MDEAKFAEFTEPKYTLTWLPKSDRWFADITVYNNSLGQWQRFGDMGSGDWRVGEDRLRTMIGAKVMGNREDKDIHLWPLANCAITSAAVSLRLKEYVDGQMTLLEFQEWLMSQFWRIKAASDDALSNLIGQIKTNIREHISQRLPESVLREILSRLLV